MSEAPTNKQKAIQRAIELCGGLMEYPQSVYEEIRAPEFIKPVPVNLSRGPHLNIPNGVDPYTYIRDYATSKDSPIIPDVFGYETVTAQKHMSRIWITEDTKYDAERNVIVIKGHYRIYQFEVWA